MISYYIKKYMPWQSFSGSGQGKRMKSFEKNEAM